MMFSNRTRMRLVAAAALLAAYTAHAAWTMKTASSEWTWCEDYVYSSARYLIACEPGRNCQVGMGVFAFGRPWGEKIGFTGEREILVIGAGAIYMRAADGKGPVKVALVQKSAELITGTISW
jgi:hypothetical protein